MMAFKRFILEVRHIPVCIMVGLLILSGCAGMNTRHESKVSAAFTSITTRPTNIYHPGKIVWHDLITPDSSESRKFYGELFGWSFRDVGGYVEIYNGKRKIGGIVEMKPKKGKNPVAGWLPSISVPDMDEAISYVKSKGGRVINGPVDMPMRGLGALITDPQGSYLAILHARGGDPQDTRAEIGEWLWNEVWTNYLELSAWFYKGLGQYESTIRGGNYVILVNEGKWRAGVRQVKEKPYSGLWVPVVRVRDPDALVPRVEKLGGMVLLKPGQGSAGKNTALIADNEGALLILQRWTYSYK